MIEETFLLKYFKHALLKFGLFFFLWPSLSLAQKYEGNVSVGLGLPAGSLGVSGIHQSSLNTGTSYSTTYSQRHMSFASGFQAQLGGTYWFKPNIAFHLDANYTLGLKQVYLQMNTQHTQTLDELNYEESYALRVLRFAPCLKTQVEFGKVQVGLIAGMSISALSYGDFYIFDESTISGNKQTNEMRADLKGRVSLGFVSGLELCYPINQQLSWYIASNFLIQDFVLKSKTVQVYNENGYNAMSKLTPNQRETVYVRKSFVQTMQVNPNEPRKELEKALPFSSITIQLGLRYRFEPKIAQR